MIYFRSKLIDISDQVLLVEKILDPDKDTLKQLWFFFIDIFTKSYIVGSQWNGLFEAIPL